MAGEFKESSARLTLGEWGEQRAAYYLEDEGWEVLAQNWRASRGEIDLIVTKRSPGYVEGSWRQVVAFVEVKTRIAASANNPPECSVTYRKRIQIVKLAKLWRRANPCWHDATIRFDVIGILADASARKVDSLRHLEAAFDAMGRC